MFFQKTLDFYIVSSCLHSIIKISECQGGFCIMPIKYKIDILAGLKEKGYSTYRIRKNKLMGEATVQKLRNKEPVSWENISTICKLLECQPGDIMEYVEDETE